MTLQEMAQYTGADYWKGSIDTAIRGVAVDSRAVLPGDVFFAMVGAEMDGHTFIPHALNKGAAAVVVSRPPDDLHIPPDVPVIVVQNTLYALWNLARNYRRLMGPTVVGITGSVGKTTTKDMTAAVLEKAFSVLKNEGNLNTEVGLPMTILKLEDHHRIAVLEMGMRGMGQIAELAAVAEPTVGIITNIGETHIELLGSIENIAKAKGELLEALPDDGVAILNGDDPWCRRLAENLNCKIYFFSARGEGDVNASNVRNDKDQGFTFTVAAEERHFDVHVQLPGLHNLDNALAAVTTGLVFGVEPEAIADGLAAFKPSKMRMDIIRRNDFTIINDTYNASPRSLAAALDVLVDMKNQGRMVAVLGDMLELGILEESGHREVGGKVAAAGVDFLLTVGKRAAVIAAAAEEAGMDPEKIMTCTDNGEAERLLRQKILPGDTVLVKGSRGMKMEEIVSVLTNIPPLVNEGGE